ncbi:MAG TPA: hypothetical protein VGF17_21105 [Phytomonospora sp.]
MLIAMDDWTRFLGAIPWFPAPGDTAVVGEARPWSGPAADDLPVLSALLGTATLTPAAVGTTDYELLAWGPPEARRGWLCHPPHAGTGVAETHRSFWRLCGGIVERFGEPTTRWTSHEEVLTVAATEVSPADTLADYAWLWEDDGLELPIDPAEYYTVAVEANGNLTLAHRDDGRLLHFAPDHAFEDVTPLPGCPPYSLHTLDEAPDLASWIETCAEAWR